MTLMRFVTAFLFTTTFSCSIASEPFDDWVDSPTPLCRGHYVEQPLPFPGKSAEFLKQQPITVESDQSHFQLEGETLLNGHVHLIEGNRQIFADHATIHREDKKVSRIDANGNVSITEPNQRLTGSQATLHIPSNTQSVENAEFRLYSRHARGSADRIVAKEQQLLTMDNASYTTCSPKDTVWALRSKTVKLNQHTGRGKAYHSRLYVYDTPIAYFPYLDFPIDERRQTGFLYPSFGITNRSGAELSTPFYWNLAPNYDATLTPRLMSKRGVELKGKFRYLTQHHEGSLESTYLHDHEFATFQQNAKNSPLPSNDPRIQALNASKNRYALHLENTTRLAPQNQIHLNYQRVSDDNYFMDFGNTLGMSATQHLPREVRWDTEHPQWSAYAHFQDFQTLHPIEGPITEAVYRKSPELHFENALDLPFQTLFGLDSTFSHFLHKPDPKTQQIFTTGNRFHARPSIARPIHTPGYYLIPRIQLNVLAYSLEGQNLKRHNPSQLTPMFDLDSGLIFERQQQSYVQTLEPRLYYLYVPYRSDEHLPNFDTTASGFSDNQLYWDNRFSGLDRIGDANQLTAGLTSRLLTPTGFETLNVSLHQLFYFKERRVTHCGDTQCVEKERQYAKRHHSPLVGMARYWFNEHWSANTELNWNHYEHRLEKKSLTLQYLFDDRSSVHFGYQFLRRLDEPSLEQTALSGMLALNQQWRLLGRWHYDINQHRSNDISFGVEQHGCCTALRLLGSRFLRPFDEKTQTRRYTNAIYLQVIFKGLGGVGQPKMNTLLKHAIPGYRWKEHGF